jgi:hypothetical protein
VDPARLRSQAVGVKGAKTGFHQGDRFWHPLQALFESDSHGVALLLADRRPDVASDGQLVRSVAEGHKRALKPVAVHGRADLHQAPCPGYGAPVSPSCREDRPDDPLSA